MRIEVAGGYRCCSAPTNFTRPNSKYTGSKVMNAQCMAVVRTDRPARYGKQLVGHLARRNGGEWSDGERTGWIQLARGVARLQCTADALRVSLDGDADALEQMQDVVARHLVRFGTKDELVVTWDGDAS